MLKEVLHESSTLDVPLKGDGRAELQVEFGQDPNNSS